MDSIRSTTSTLFIMESSVEERTADTVEDKKNKKLNALSNVFKDWKHRPEQLKCALEIAHCLATGKYHLIVRAQVKWGKKIVKLILTELLLHMYDPEGNKNIPDTFACITSLNRTDCKEQLEQLEECGIHCFVVTKSKGSKEALKFLTECHEQGKKVLIHFDESDYGTGVEQKMEDVYHIARAYNFPIVYYSATNFEALCSPLAEDAHTIAVQYSKNFRGAYEYINCGLVKEAHLFVNEKGIATRHAQEVVKDFVSSNKKLMVVRLAGGKRNEEGCSHFRRAEDNPKFENPLLELGVKKVYFFNPNKEGKDFWNSRIDRMLEYGKLIVVINQTCTRSAEIMCQKDMFAWHDYRPRSSNVNTIIQSSLRPTLYSDKHPQTRIYTCVASIKLAAGLIDEDECVRLTGRKLSSRVASRITKLDKEATKTEVFKTIKELEAHCNKHNINIKKKLKDYKKGQREDTRRGVTRLWKLAEIEKDLLFGFRLSKDGKEVNQHRVFSFDGGFILIQHDGSTQVKNSSSTNKSIFTN